jgi:hypothetical protein
VLTFTFPQAYHVHCRREALVREILHRLYGMVNDLRLAAVHILECQIKAGALALCLFVKPHLREPEVNFYSCENLHWLTTLHSWRELPFLDRRLSSLVKAEA